jgi:nicotinate phosphoribosyltransferase
MLQAYETLDMNRQSVFSLFVRTLPEKRNFLLACGLYDVLKDIEQLQFFPEDIAFLRSLGRFPDAFLDRLGSFRFTGDIYAVPEGTPVFAQEPILEVVAPLGEAQVLETFLLNQIGIQTILASKAWRIVRAAGGRPVVDFGSRRAQGIDAAISGARAFAIAGVSATSNLLAGKALGFPVMGTVAHSFIEAFASEDEAFRALVCLQPTTTVLVDTYDTLAAVRRLIELARDGGPAARVTGIRLDSGDLAGLARQARDMLDGAGLKHIRIVASGGLDEARIASLVSSGAPIDSFGVGTAMSVSDDAPALDIAYKLTAYAGMGRMKLSPGKTTLPFRKQVFRDVANGVAMGDTIALAEEDLTGIALLRPAMRGGTILDTVPRDWKAALNRAKRSTALLPENLLAIAPSAPSYRVSVSERLQEAERSLRTRLEHATRSGSSAENVRDH